MPKTILVVDDDKDFRALLALALGDRGHRVVEARTGAEANSALAGGGIDLVVVDGLLPDTDGVRWIAGQRAAGRALPVVFVSAFWRDLGSFNRLTKDLGVALVLHKPVEPGLLLSELAPWLHEPTAPPPARPLEAVQALAREYRGGLPGKAQELEEALRRLRTTPADSGLRQEATTLAHRLHGTAGSYGFHEVGEAAGDLEAALSQLDLERLPEGWGPVELGLARLARAAHGAASEPPAGPQASSAPAPVVASGRILAVSRNPTFLEQVRAAGRHQLFEVLCAGDARQARDAAATTPPDAALLDLPPDEAAALARELRSLPGCDPLAIAFVSAAQTAPNRVAAAHAGASLFLALPVDAQGLAAATRQLVAMATLHRPRVLVVDDDDDFAKRACAALERRGIGTRRLGEPGRILEVLEEAPPDLLLLDVAMPGISGLDVCRILRSTPRWQDLPIVIVTAQSGLDARIAAFRCGADDYLSKPVVDEELLARVEVRVERARLLRERYDKDALTGLLLRRPLVESLRARLLEAARHGRPLALGLVDFDKFKAINDTHGHLAGDAVLAAFGKLVGRRFRAEDLRGRWGGEEFLLAFPGETAATIQGALERLQAEFAQIDFRGDAGESFRAGFSVGVAGFPEDGLQLEELVRTADRRLFAGKRAGGGRVVGKG